MQILCLLNAFGHNVTELIQKKGQGKKKGKCKRHGDAERTMLRGCEGVLRENYLFLYKGQGC